MANIIFASMVPHPPILLPWIGSEKDRLKLKETLEALDILANDLKKSKPDSIIISSPHQDWGFNVPLHFLSKDFKGEIKQYLIGSEPPEFYFEKGKKLYNEFEKNKRYALIASGDMSHCLKEEGPYGFHSDGPKYDKAFKDYLVKKDIKKIQNLDKIFPEAGECGLRSFCFLLGILDKEKWKPKILSYQSPFGVGYLTAKLK